MLSWFCNEVTAIIRAEIWSLELNVGIVGAEVLAKKVTGVETAKTSPVA